MNRDAGIDFQCRLADLECFRTAITFLMLTHPLVILQTSHGRRSIDVLKLLCPERANWDCKLKPLSRSTSRLFYATKTHLVHYTSLHPNPPNLKSQDHTTNLTVPSRRLRRRSPNPQRPRLRRHRNPRLPRPTRPPRVPRRTLGDRNLGHPRPRNRMARRDETRAPALHGDGRRSRGRQTGPGLLSPGSAAPGLLPRRG
jgi:hypothetical protein